MNNFMRDSNRQLVQPERRRFVYFRDAAGRMCWRLRRWYDEKIFHVIAVCVLMLVASTCEYWELVDSEKQKRLTAEHEARVAAGMYRAEGVIYLIEARNLQEFDVKIRRIRNEIADTEIHSKAAQQK